MDIVSTLPPALLIGAFVSTILPLLVGLVTKVVTNGSVKAVLLAALSAVTGLLVELGAAVGADRPYDIGVGATLALLAFLVATGSHFGFWKPQGVSKALQRFGVQTPGVSKSEASNGLETPTGGATIVGE